MQCDKIVMGGDVMAIMSKIVESWKRVNYINYDNATPFCVIEMGWEQTKPNHTWSPNGRPRYLIHLIKDGKISVTRADGTVAHLTKGDAFINAPDEASIMKSDSQDPCEYYWIAFNGKDARAILEKTTQSLYPRYKESGLFAIKELLDNSISETIGTLFALFNVLNSIKDESKGDKDDFVKTAVLYIESNYHKQFDVGKYAKSIGVSRSHFTTVFTKRIGMSPYNLLMNERIENAKKYLINSDLTISQIATKTGFASIERFSTVFKTKTGMSPKKFRDSVKILT